MASTAAVILMLSGCGGVPQRQSPVGFLNHTIHTEAQLRSIWRSAQESLAREIDLNPLERQLDSDVLPDKRAGDPRALGIDPHQVEVAAERDVSAGFLYSVTGIHRNDPTGLIPCPQPCNVRYAAAYSKYKEAVTKYASSWDSQGNNFELILQYEFENQILFALNYDMKWR